MANVVASPAAAFHPHPSVGSEHATMLWRVFCRPPSQCPTLFDDGRFAFVVGGIVLEGVFADQVIEARSAGFAHRRQLVVGVGGHGIVHDAVFFQAGQCLVVLLADSSYRRSRDCP